MAPVAARASIASTRTFDGPEPNRPSAGLIESGMVMGAVTVASSRECADWVT